MYFTRRIDWFGLGSRVAHEFVSVIDRRGTDAEEHSSANK
jgi:hypothetical protein